MAASPQEPAAPRIRRLDLPDLAAAAGGPEPGRQYEAMRFAAAGGTIVDAARSGFYECSIERLGTGTFISAPASFVDTVLSRPDIVSWTAASSRWRNAEIRQGRVGSLDLAGATLDGVRFTDLRIGHANFRQARLTDVEFDGCSFGSLDLAGAAVTRVRWQSSSAAEVDLRGCGLVDADLRGLDFEDLDGINSVRGATITSAQLDRIAPVLARAAGLRVLQ